MKWQMAWMVAGMGMGLTAGSARAHHSYAMFDRDKSVTMAGVVRTWEFSNPHSYLWVYVNDAAGKPQLWGLESLSPGALAKVGLNKATVQPGEKVTVVINPLKDGRNGGNLVKITLASGKTLTIGVLPGGQINQGPTSKTNEPRAGEVR